MNLWTVCIPELDEEWWCGWDYHESTEVKYGFQISLRFERDQLVLTCHDSRGVSPTIIIFKKIDPNTNAGEDGPKSPSKILDCLTFILFFFLTLHDLTFGYPKHYSCSVWDLFSDFIAQQRTIHLRKRNLNIFTYVLYCELYMPSLIPPSFTSCTQR